MKLRLAAYIILILSISALNISYAELLNAEESKQKINKYGYYVGSVKTEWLDNNREMKLLSTLKYIDPNGKEWEAEQDAIIDGASIPQFLWSMIGSPFTGKYRNASVIHDIACVEKKEKWQIVHKTFFYAMRASDVSPLKAKIMYAAVNNFGPRWKTNSTRGENMIKRLSDEEFNKLVARIKETEKIGTPMSVDEIQNFMNKDI